MSRPPFDLNKFQNNPLFISLKVAVLELSAENIQNSINALNAYGLTPEEIAEIINYGARDGENIALKASNSSQQNPSQEFQDKKKSVILMLISHGAYYDPSSLEGMKESLQITDKELELAQLKYVPTQDTFLQDVDKSMEEDEDKIYDAFLKTCKKRLPPKNSDTSGYEVLEEFYNKGISQKLVAERFGRSFIESPDVTQKYQTVEDRAVDVIGCEMWYGLAHIQAFEAAKLRHQDRKLKPAKALPHFGCKTLGQYLEYLEKLPQGDFYIQVTGASNKTSEKISAFTGKELASIIREMVSQDKSDKKLLNSKDFFHHFALQLNLVKAQSQQSGDVLSQEMQACTVPSNKTFQLQSLGGDLAGKFLGVYYAESQGPRESNEDSFAVGSADFNPKQAEAKIMSEAVRLGKMLAKEESGTTAAIVHVSKNKITAVNIGDTRVVYYKKDAEGNFTALRLTADSILENRFDMSALYQKNNPLSGVSGFFRRNIKRDGKGDLRFGEKGLNMSNSWGDEDITLGSPQMTSFDVPELEDGEEVYVGVYCDGYFEHLNEAALAKALEKWSQNEENLQEKFEGNIALFLETSAMSSGTTDNTTGLLYKLERDSNHVMVVADGHGGKKASSLVALEVSKRLMKEKDRVVHLASDLGIDYDPKKSISKQIIHKSRSDESVLGLKKSQKQPKDFLNSYNKFFIFVNKAWR